MFRDQGSARSERQNRLVAGYLAFIGGFVNSVGFVLMGTFTSHATGNVGRFASDLATHQTSAAATAFLMIAAFVTGAFAASMCIESGVFSRVPNAYATAVSCEAALLIAFTVLSSASATAHPRLRDMEAALLCAAMGMQNSLVTRLSGAVVRTTHLTGVLTDLGIEGARWFRWWRGRLSAALRMPLSFGTEAPERPSSTKIVLLATIAASFTSGAVLGSVMGAALRHAAMVLPIVAIGAGAASTFATSGKSGRDSLAPGPETRR